MVAQKNILIMVGIISLSYAMIFLFAPKDVVNNTIADTEYWRETENRLLLKTTYDYNDKYSMTSFPKTLGEWKSSEYRYPDRVYDKLNADILMSRGYSKGNKSVIWMDIVNSKTGESFHKQRVCVEGAGWTVNNESITELKIADPPNPFTKLYVNRLDISKGDKKQVIMYWFMFKKFGYEDSVTMIRLSSSVKNNDTEATYNHIRGFVERQLFNTMYKDTKDDITVVEYLIEKYGNRGIVSIAIVLLVLVGIIVTGIRRND